MSLTEKKVRSMKGDVGEGRRGKIVEKKRKSKIFLFLKHWEE